MKIDLYTSAMVGGWHPDDIDKFLGGNEEADVRLSEELVKWGANVTVYTTLCDVDEAVRNGVHYRQREAFQSDSDRSILIATKDIPPGDCKGRKIYWCVDVQDVSKLLKWADDFVVLGNYHLSRLPWLDHKSVHMIPYGIDSNIDTESKDQDLAIYTTSPYRGLDRLLIDWSIIRSHRPNLKLQVTYKWDENSNGHYGKQHKFLNLLLSQDGITHGTLTRKEMDELYAKAKYWIHTLNNPDGDLIGFSAMKASQVGCQLVIPGAIGGFRDAVHDYTPYANWVMGFDGIIKNTLATVIPEPWSTNVSKYWIPLLESKKWNVEFASTN